MNGLVLDTSALLAVLYRCYLVTRVPKTVSAAAPPGLEILDITQTWD